MASIWTETAKAPHFVPLEGDIRTDVLVIGGGMAGILCAHFLQESGVSCVVAEAKTVGSGITKDTTAKITAQHGLIYDTLLRRLGPGKAGAYLRANLEAVEAYGTLCQNIPCDFERKDNFIFERDDRGILEREMAALKVLGAPAELTENLPLPFPTVGAVKFPNQAQFHPLKFLFALASGLTVYENTPIRELRKGCAVTDRGKIFADRILVATHFPFLNKHGSYFLKLYQSRSYVLSLSGAPQLPGMYLDGQKNGLSFRNFGSDLLLGGGGYRTGKPGGGWEALSAAAKEFYPQAKITRRWAAQDCMSLDGVPYIGPYSTRTPELYVATGFNKWGMTSSMVAARVLTDLITGKDSEYASLFSPSRSILRPQLAVNAWEATTNLLTFSKKRCPHLGCALKWNPHERTWDCPCHGSRFSEDGQLIDNPATGDLPDR